MYSVQSPELLRPPIKWVIKPSVYKHFSVSHRYMDEVNESDCCGNGCANCVLDIKRTISDYLDKSGKKNILEKYTKFVLIKKSLHFPQVENVWELHFKSKCSDNNEFILDIDVGHHLMMRKDLMEKKNDQNKDNDLKYERKYLLRPYSPFWWDPMELEFKILIKLIRNGAMSEHIKTLEIKDEVEFRGPIGKFHHEVDQTGGKYLLIISQGVAIAPVIPIIDIILKNEDDMTKIVHIACFQNLNNVYFRDKLYNLGRYWNYKAHIFLSNELCDHSECVKNCRCTEKCNNFKSKLKYKETIYPNRFTENELIKIVNSINNKESTFITISGTGKFQNYFKQLCETIKCGFLNNNIYLL